MVYIGLLHDTYIIYYLLLYFSQIRLRRAKKKRKDELELIVNRARDPSHFEGLKGRSKTEDREGEINIITY